MIFDKWYGSVLNIQTCLVLSDHIFQFPKTQKQDQDHIPLNALRANC